MKYPFEVFKNCSDTLSQTNLFLTVVTDDFYAKDLIFDTIMIMLNLLLQKPYRNSQSKIYLDVLKRGLSFQKEGKFTELLTEDCIQKGSKGQ